MNRRNHKIYVVTILTLLLFTTSMWGSGFHFIVSQYIFYRYLDDAGLPYPPVTTVSSREMTNVSAEQDRNKEAEAQAKAARLLSASVWVSLALGIFPSVIVGRLSDQRGRRLALGLTLLGQSLYSCTVALMIFLRLPLSLTILGSCFSGLLGGGAISFIMQVNVCLTDVTSTSIDTKVDLSPDEVAKRTRQERRRLVLLGAFDGTMALGAAAANGFIGSIVERYGFIESLLCMLGVFCCTVIFIWILPETGKPLANPVPNDTTLIPSNLPLNDRSNVCPTPSDLCAKFKSLLSSITSILSTHNPMSILALLVIFSINLVLLPENNYIFLYLMAKPFSWSPEQVGLFSALIAFLMAVLCVCLAGIAAWSMKTEPPVMTTNVGSPDQAEPSLVINSEEEEQIPLLCADRDHRHQILHNRLKMIIYAMVSLLAVVISRTMLGFAFLLPNPSCTVFVLFALFLNMVRSSLMPTLQSFLSSLHDATKQAYCYTIYSKKCAPPESNRILMQLSSRIHPSQLPYKKRYLLHVRFFFSISTPYISICIFLIS
ncbi:hypothetical protein CRM22_004147 [Opisthorchis felineus]|uniref:Major facilitator superfamily (MFS) profile domain-containing protein n=2 Tax=Opisthorchis felineus TaxID=147828 RepID=A0A4S2LXP4_OPIFE|nr:hypothetical protein CRM22_004147 [Opisthorchis felineus]